MSRIIVMTDTLPVWVCVYATF